MRSEGSVVAGDGYSRSCASTCQYSGYSLAQSRDRAPIFVVHGKSPEQQCIAHKTEKDERHSEKQFQMHAFNRKNERQEPCAYHNRAEKRARDAVAQGKCL